MLHNLELWREVNTILPSRTWWICPWTVRSYGLRDPAQFAHARRDDQAGKGIMSCPGQEITLLL